MITDNNSQFIILNLLQLLGGKQHHTDARKFTLMERFKNAMLGPPDNLTEQTPEEQEENYEPHDQRLKFLKQSKFWFTFLNINAIIVMGICVFLYGFFH
jgi:hypothetical protein